MSLLPDLTTYYEGERLEAVLLAVFGFLATGLVLAGRITFGQNQMLKGLAYPMGFLGVFTLCVGAFNAHANTRRLNQLPGRYASEAAAVVRAEVTRFEGPGGVNTWWAPLKTTWAACIVLGLILSFSSRREITNGIAIGLMLIGAMGFLIDGFAHRRATVYTAALCREAANDDVSCGSRE